MVEIPITQVDNSLPTPSYARYDDAGVDLIASESVEISPGGGRAIVSTGVSIAIPSGHAGFVQPRSGLAAKHGVTVLNSPGLIDAGYRGELKVILLNTDPTTTFRVEPGDRIAQLVIQKVEHATFVPVDVLPSDDRDDARGIGGFGHSGISVR